MKIETREDYDRYRHWLPHRIATYFWLAGVIVACPGSTYAFWIRHNHLESQILTWVGVVIMLPHLGFTLYALRQGLKRRKQLLMKKMILETILELAHPEEYERKENINKVKDLFK